MSSQDSDVQMQLDPVGSETAINPPDHDASDEYSDFGDDPEALEIIDRLLAAVSQQNREADAPLQVTDIEDYEGPQGVYLPKMPGYEIALPRFSHGPQRTGTQGQQILRYEGGTFRRNLLCSVLLTS